MVPGWFENLVEFIECEERIFGGKASRRLAIVLLNYPVLGELSLEVPDDGVQEDKSSL